VEKSGESEVLLLTPKLVEEAERFYDDACVEAKGSARFMAKGDGFSLSVYGKKDGQGRVKALFQGPAAQSEAKIWLSRGALRQQEAPAEGAKPPSLRPKPSGPFPFHDQIGSDEVGTGDFFGPVCVVAAFVDRAGLAEVDKLGITDSKKMEDSYILEIGPQLVRDFDYSSLSLGNEKYNALEEGGMNLNAIKAKMHNAALLHLAERHPDARVYQDQFAAPPLYFSYLKDEDKVLRDIFFSVRGESKFPSVALASVLARYSFLRKMEDLSARYGEEIPLGAGPRVDRFAARFLKKHGPAELKKICKANFKNYKKLMGNEK